LDKIFFNKNIKKKRIFGENFFLIKTLKKNAFLVKNFFNKNIKKKRIFGEKFILNKNIKKKRIFGEKFF